MQESELKDQNENELNSPQNNAEASSDKGSGEVKAELSPEEKVIQAEKDSLFYKDQFLRKAAEFENFRRRKEEEVVRQKLFAEESIIKSLLPVMDDIGRVLKNSEKFLADNPGAEQFVGGVRLVQQKFLRTLEERGVKKFDTLGKKFDVEFHDALTQVEHGGADSDTVVEEYEPGYTLHEKVIRHAKVVVAK